MDTDDKVPVLIFHVLEANVSQDTRIVDQDVDTTEIGDRSLNYFLAILNAVVVGYSLSTCSLDLVDNDVCGL